jgi:Holliday junction resolvase
MEKPKPPLPQDYNVTEAEIASTPDIANSHAALGWSWLAIMAVVGIWQVRSLTIIELTKHWLFYALGALVIVAMYGFFVGLAASLFCSGLDRALRIAWPKYARVNRFRAAERQYRKVLAAYDAWVRRQAEAFWASLDGISFERELGRLFRNMGYSVSTTPRTGDGGVDLILVRAGVRTVVQCKAHASKVGIATARELVASMIDFQAQVGILAATSGVTKPVTEYVQGKNIQILDLTEILRLQRAHG